MSGRSPADVFNDAILIEYFKRMNEFRINEPDVHLIYTSSTEQIPSVKLILSIQSEYFKALFERWKGNDETLHLEFLDNTPSYPGGIPLNTFKIMHNYIFDPFNVPDVLNDRSLEGHLEGLFCLADYYGIEFLITSMNEYTDIINLENCLVLLELSVDFEQQLKNLGDACGRFISKNLTDLESNILELNSKSLSFLFKKDTFYLPEERIFNISLNW
jgi:hypothetical protein